MRMSDEAWEMRAGLATVAVLHPDMHRISEAMGCVRGVEMRGGTIPRASGDITAEPLRSRLRGIGARARNHGGVSGWDGVGRNGEGWGARFSERAFWAASSAGLRVGRIERRACAKCGAWGERLVRTIWFSMASFASSRRRWGIAAAAAAAAFAQLREWSFHEVERPFLMRAVASVPRCFPGVISTPWFW